jgi:hypothetical protein
MRQGNAALALGILLYIPTVGCTAASPVAPAPLPPFAISSPDGWPITADMEADTPRTWAEVGLCLGTHTNPPPGYPIHVRKDMIDCGGVPAWGCWNGPLIEVTGPVYSMALRHEMTHLALYLAGRDYGEQAPDLLRCER